MQSLETRSAPDRPVKSAGAHAVLRVLQDWGIDLVLTCPGSTEGALLDISPEYPGVRVVLTTHESIAVAAADGFARASGRPAVAYLHTNVGLANGIAHLSCAQRAATPLVVLNGMKSTLIANRGGFTTASHPRDYVRQHVVFDRVALRAGGIGEDLTRALKAATAEPGGPVYLGLPQDLVEAEGPVVAPEAKRHRVAARRRPDPDAVAEAARRLAAARRVTIVLGGNAIARAGARAALVALADALDAPVVLEDRRTLETIVDGGVDATRFAGFYEPRNPAVAEADVLFFAGMPAFVEFDVPRGPAVPAGATIVHLHDDPEQIAKVAPADVALAGNVALGLHDVADALAALGARRDQGTGFRARAVAAYREAAAVRRTQARGRAAAQPVAVDALCAALADALPEDATIVGDAVTSSLDLLELTLAGSRRSCYTTAGGSLGWGMGAAVGIALAKPGRRIHSVIGDGVFQFGIQALFTARQLALPITTVVIDNASYAAVKAAVKRYRGGATPDRFVATDLSGIDIATIARGFGVFATTVSALDALPAALAEADAQAGPSVVVVKTDPHHTGP